MKRFLTALALISSVAVISAHDLGPWYVIGRVAGSVVSLPGIPIQTTDNPQTVVNANSGCQPNCVFLIKSGIHRLWNVDLGSRNGDTFNGESGAIVSGAKNLTPGVVTWTSSTCHSIPCWTIGGQTQQGFINDEGMGCGGPTGWKAGSDNPEGVYFDCFVPEDLYFDNIAKYHCNALSTCTGIGTCTYVGAPNCGGWYFDYSADIIYVFDNPATHSVETSVTDHAFINGGSNIKFANFTIEKYADPYDSPTIALGNGWVADGIEARWNHYSGVDSGCNSVLKNSHIHHNGAFGLHGGCNAEVGPNNEVDHNNYTATIDIFWGAGGSKWDLANGMYIHGNNVHDNYGPGFWTDISNINITYDSNTFSDNFRAGIFHEVSYSATITNNTLSRNGNSCFGSLPTDGCIGTMDSGRAVPSHDVLMGINISGNVCTDNYFNIGGAEDDRAGNTNQTQVIDGLLYYEMNLSVHNNTINSVNVPLTPNCPGSPIGNPTIYNPGTGIQNYSGTAIYTSQNNVFANNTYHLANNGLNFFLWNGVGNDSQWQALWTGETIHRP